MFSGCVKTCKGNLIRSLCLEKICVGVGVLTRSLYSCLREPFAWSRGKAGTLSRRLGMVEDSRVCDMRGRKGAGARSGSSPSPGTNQRRVQDGVAVCGVSSLDQGLSEVPASTQCYGVSHGDLQPCVSLLGLPDKTPRPGRRKQRKFILSPFQSQRPQVKASSGLVSSASPEGRVCPRPSPWLADGHLLLRLLPSLLD